MTALNSNLLVHGDKTTVRLEGALDMAATDDLIALAGVATSRAEMRTLILDMGGVEFMDSMGLASLVRTRKMCADAGAVLELRCLQPRVRHVLALTGLAEWFSLDEVG